MYKKGDYVVYRRDVCIIRDIKESKLKKHYILCNESN